MTHYSAARFRRQLYIISFKSFQVRFFAHPGMIMRARGNPRFFHQVEGEGIGTAKAQG